MIASSKVKLTTNVQKIAYARSRSNMLSVLEGTVSSSLQEQETGPTPFQPHIFGPPPTAEPAKLAVPAVPDGGKSPLKRAREDEEGQTCSFIFVRN
jgi:hypothetical protein